MTIYSISAVYLDHKGIHIYCIARSNVWLTASMIVLLEMKCVDCAACLYVSIYI
jgi:hypothetical protein